MYEYNAKVDRVVDGDTVDFIVDLGFNINIKIRTRLIGVDTPERGHPDWKKATETCARLLGSVADKVRSFRPPEPYKGTGVRLVDEVIIRKAGKAKS